MITPATGEINFSDGLCITAHSTMLPLRAAIPAGLVAARSLPVPGWSQHLLGEHLPATARS
jgi:hypothetical protein